MSTSGDRGRRADAVRNRELALAAATALLAQPGTPLTVEAIAKQAGLGAATVVRAFGGKDALLDAAVAGLLEPVVRRGRDLLGAAEALRTFLAELMAFQSAHHALGQYLGPDMPATTALRTELEDVVRTMIDDARRNGTIRTDIDPAALSSLIRETAYAVARTDPTLIDTYLTVLTDGLRP